MNSIANARPTKFAGQRSENIKAFLCRIALSLGMNEHESFHLAQEVWLAGEKVNSSQISDLPREIWMSKLLIRKCIFSISVKMFNEEKWFTSSFQNAGNFVYLSSLQTVPFSFRIVYTLFHTIGFSKEEIAEILNITSVQVNDRLAKATKMIR